MHQTGAILAGPHTKNIDTAAISTRAHRRQMAAMTLTSLFCAAMIGCCQPNDPNCRNVSFGPSGAGVAGVAIGVGAVVATAITVEVHHAHHTLNGCVSDGTGSLQLLTQGGNKIYALTGKTTNVKTGERVRLHGTRVKLAKGSTATPIFLVERQTKDYGACKTKALPSSAP